MKTADLDYELPEALIAQQPLENRDASRLLVLDRAAESFEESSFAEIAAHLRAGDCLALNDTRVIRARLRARKASGGKVELFLLRELANGEWQALVRPSARVKPGTEVLIGDDMSATVEEPLASGSRKIRFSQPNVLELLESRGEVPLPPYIHRTEPDERDAARYQTVYGRAPGAVAAPTAGLHYTERVLQSLEARGVDRATLTLHVGYGTFKPIKCERLEDHQVDAEDFDFPADSAARLDRTRAEGGRVVAVGTTATRVLESRYVDGSYQPGSGTTDCYIYPPYAFGAVDVLQTNFHLPQSSLLALVCVFAGTDFVLEAYRYAVEKQFRFYSYGDAMLIL